MAEVAAELLVERHLDVARARGTTARGTSGRSRGPARRRRRRARASIAGTVLRRPDASTTRLAAIAGRRRGGRRRSTGTPSHDVVGQAGDAARRAQLDAGLGQRGLAQQPLQRRAAHDQHRQVLVAGLRLAEVVAGRHGDAARRRSSAASTSGKWRRISTTRRARKPWVWWTCGAPRRSAANASSASPLVGSGVAVEHEHLVAGPPERQRGAQPADPRSDPRRRSRAAERHCVARSWATAS